MVLQVIIEQTYHGIEMKMQVSDIDIASYEGHIEGDLIVYEKGGDAFEGMVLHGFDEVGMFEGGFDNPQYAITTTIL